MSKQAYIDLKTIRERVGLGQSEFATMLGTSLRTVQACEQGWRNPGPAVEKAAMLLLMVHHHGPAIAHHSCWQTVQCPEDERADCVVHQTRQGHICWLLSGHNCRGARLQSWEDKKRFCLECEYVRELFPQGVPTL